MLHRAFTHITVADLETDTADITQLSSDNLCSNDILSDDTRPDDERSDDILSNDARSDATLHGGAYGADPFPDAFPDAADGTDASSNGANAIADFAHARSDVAANAGADGRDARAD
jgi:hypothetical protein